MKLRYVVRGIVQEGDRVRLLLKSADNLVKKSQDFMEMAAGGAMGLMNRMVDQTRRETVPDTICIPLADFKQRPLKIDDVVTLDVSVD